MVISCRENLFGSLGVGILFGSDDIFFIFFFFSLFLKFFSNYFLIQVVEDSEDRMVIFSISLCTVYDVAVFISVM